MDKIAVVIDCIGNPTLNDEISTSDTDFDSETTMSLKDTTVSSADSFSSDDHNEILLFPLMKYLTTGKKRCRIENYLHIVESLTDAEFKEHFRLARHTAFRLIDELHLSNVISSQTFGMQPIPAKLSFLIFLWFMANTEPLRTISDRFDVSISSVFRIIRRVMCWLKSKLDDVVSWPKGRDILTVHEQFYTKQGIRNILGAIDCSHIPIKQPSINPQDYCNRKKFFSINLQAVVDANTRFTNIYVGEPGSLHDARVLRRSPLFHIASEHQELLFPNNSFIIGDSAYPSLPWLVPPFRDNGHLTPQQKEFNFIHSSTRMAVERSFGLLKGRFRRIQFFTEYREMSFITDTVVAACMLHNYCANLNDNYDFPEHVDNNIENINIGEVHEINNRVLDRRMTLFQEIFPGHRGD